MIKSNNSNDDKDPNSFIFSINKLKIYENLKKKIMQFAILQVGVLFLEVMLLQFMVLIFQ